MDIRTTAQSILIAALAVGVTACEDAAAPEPGAALVSVAPESGASDVAADATVTLTFDGAMAPTASDYVRIHRGEVTGPAVEGDWGMENGGRVMRFTPGEPWAEGTGHTIHVGGGMMDAEGHRVDLAGHGPGMGGRWVDGGMMGTGHGHMGEGWQDGHGSYGMTFDFSTAAPAGSTALVSVDPAAGETDVDPSAPVTVTFDHAVDPAMTAFAALHEGDVRGPEVAGGWALSADSTRLVFTQDAPLARGTQYTIHLGGGMMDASGSHVDLGGYGTHMGGTWATGTMMGGMGGMHGHHDHMGDGWEHPENGSYGMLFTFTTAG